MKEDRIRGLEANMAAAPAFCKRLIDLQEQLKDRILQQSLLFSRGVSFDAESKATAVTVQVGGPADASGIRSGDTEPETTTDPSG